MLRMLGRSRCGLPPVGGAKPQRVLNHLPKNPLHTLRGRLATTYAVLAAIGVAASALYTATTVRSGLHDWVVLDLADEARLIADQVSGPLARGDIAAVDDYVRRAETLTHVRLVVVNPAGDTVAVTSGS